MPARAVITLEKKIGMMKIIFRISILTIGANVIPIAYTAGCRQKSLIFPGGGNNVLRTVKELIKQNKFRNTGEITFQGGEPTILKEFSQLLELFIEKDSKVRVHSSGIIFSRAVREGIKKGCVTVVISPDSASKNIYKTIKRVDKSDKVWANIRHYRRRLKDVRRFLVKVKYIIIPGINDTFDEVSLFLDKIKKFDIKSVIVDIEYTYANTNTNNISPHVYILMDYIEHFCRINNIAYELYDSALYADKSRTFKKTDVFTSDELKKLIEKHKNDNLQKNIKYT